MGVAMKVLGSWRRLTGLVIVAAVGLLALGLVPDAKGATSVTTNRFQGIDRYATARDIAEKTFTGADFVLLARGDQFPDALAGSYLASGTPTGPILLTTPNALSPAAATAITNLKSRAVIILGGTQAVSAAVEQDLANRGLTVRRLGGNDRYETAKLLAQAYPAASIGKLGDPGQPTAILATGERFADALAGGPLAFKGHFPIILTTPNALHAQADQALSNLGIKRVLILGGTQAVAASVATAVQNKGITVQRLEGPNRRATAAAIANFGRGIQGLYNSTHVNLARGDDPQGFADALSGGPHGGKDGSPILLAESPSALGTDTRTYLQQASARIESIDVFGGTQALSDAVVNDAKSASTCSPTTSTTTGTSLPVTTLPITITTAASTTTSTTTVACVVTGGSTTTTAAGGSTTTTAGGATSTTTTLLGGIGGGITCPPFPELLCDNPLGGLPTTTSLGVTTTTVTLPSTTAP